MNFCPNCGTKLIENAKFCSNCGLDLNNIIAKQQSSIETQPVENSNNETTANATSPRNADKQRSRDSAEHLSSKELKSGDDNVDNPDAVRKTLEEKYSAQLTYPKDEQICAVDGNKIGFLSGHILLADGYYVCQKHFKNVYLDWPNKNDTKPDLISFLEKLNDPNHEREYLPDEQKRQEKRRAEAAIAREQLHQQAEANRQKKSAMPDKKRTYHSGISCPRCHSTSIQLIAENTNIKKTKKTSSINLNPAHPLTVFNHNEKKVKKHSGAKIAAGIMTGGTSLLVTGTHSNKSREFHCQDCGKTWSQK